jgi:hypothetical protein
MPKMKMSKANKKHEMMEGPAARMKEYGSKTAGMKPKKATPKKMKKGK